MSLKANMRYLVAVTIGGETRDLGAAKMKTGGEITLQAAKDRPGSGELEVVHAGQSSQDNVTLTMDWDRLRTNYSWLAAGIESNTAVITGQRLSGGVPVERVESLPCVLTRIGEIPADANGDDISDVELEFMTGRRAS